jgi:hypothetical protein
MLFVLCQCSITTTRGIHTNTLCCGVAALYVAGGVVGQAFVTAQAGVCLISLAGTLA